MHETSYFVQGIFNKELVSNFNVQFSPCWTHTHPEHFSLEQIPNNPLSWLCKRSCFDLVKIHSSTFQLLAPRDIRICIPQHTHTQSSSTYSIFPPILCNHSAGASNDLECQRWNALQATSFAAKPWHTDSIFTSTWKTATTARNQTHDLSQKWLPEMAIHDDCSVASSCLPQSTNNYVSQCCYMKQSGSDP